MILLALKDQKLDSHQREIVQNHLMDRLVNKRFISRFQRLAQQHEACLVRESTIERGGCLAGGDSEV
jgi:hypothetical protein